MPVRQSAKGVTTAASVQSGLGWYWRRLRAMSAQELLHRAVEQYRRRTGRRLGGWRRYSALGVEVGCAPIDPDVFAALSAKLEPELEELWIHAAAGSLQYLGREGPPTHAENGLSGEIWSLDPISGRRWPSEEYCFSIPYRRNRQYGDIKYVWELNRLQFLPPLAALYRRRKDGKIRDWCLATLASWMECNPPYQGVNWCSGIELALRAVSVTLTVSLLGKESIPAEMSARLAGMMNAHAQWLFRFPSRGSSANNHLIAEAAALYIIGALTPKLVGAERYREYGYRVLVEESQRQILADGVGAEQSPSYQAFTLEWYLLAGMVAKSCGRPFPDPVMRRMEKSVEYLGWITDGSGRQPRVGDDDEGRVILSGYAPERDYVTSVLGSLAEWTASTAIPVAESKPHLRQLWMPHGKTCATRLLGQKCFAAGGYTVFRASKQGRESLLLFDHGPLGYLSIAAHGHADALSVWLHVDGQPLFIDSGTYLYHAGAEQRTHYRSTGAHNTLELDGESQSRIAGPFNWMTKARAGLTSGGGASEVVTAYHDGYLRSHGVVTVRSVEQTATGYRVTDRLKGRLKGGELPVRVRWFLAPGVLAAAQADGSVWLQRERQTVARLRWELAGHTVAAQIQACVVSPAFGVEADGTVLVVEARADQLCADGLSAMFELGEMDASKA